MQSKGLFVFIFLLFLTSFYYSQEEGKEFFIRPILGITGSQVDGDNYAGYKKPGIYIGSFVGLNFGQKWTGSFGLAYIQKGAWQNSNPNQGNYITYHLNINYLDVPIQITRKYTAFDLTAGLSYSQFISYKETNTLGSTNFNNNLKRFDVGWMLGAEKKVYKEWYCGFRFNYSLLPMREFFYSASQPKLVYYNVWGKLFNRGFYNNVLMFYVTKEINPRKKSE
jgi:hypothetical protein